MRKKERYINVFEDQNWPMRQLVYNKNGVFTHSATAHTVKERREGERDKEKYTYL